MLLLSVLKHIYQKTVLSHGMIFLTRNTTMLIGNSDWYTTICLPEVFGEIRKTNRRRRIIFHYYKASSNTSAHTSDFLSTRNIILMGHPPNSADLSPNCFFLFSHMKNIAMSTFDAPSKYMYCSSLTGVEKVLWQFNVFH